MEGLLQELRKLPKETEWLEFKSSYAEPKQIGEYLSALANSATLLGKPNAYLVWGIDNNTHEVIGTTFKSSQTNVKNEELENWLLRQTAPKINFAFHEFKINDLDVVLLEIDGASTHPVAFNGIEYIRIGSYKKKLKEYPEKERELWRIFDKTPFESIIALAEVTSDEVIMTLDYPSYFDLLHIPLPETKENILQALAADSLIKITETGKWDITNLGAILFAKKLSDFEILKRKAVRVIQYRGNNRVETIKEQEGVKGYANGFEGLISFINSLLPSNEIIEQALRKTVPVYPELAVRELLVNALIHQDFSISGSGPMIEIFNDYMEINNPGKPLIDVERFLNAQPRSRNEKLASLMRRFGICEERGSGIDKVVSQTEFYQLPAPQFEVIEDNTRSVLFSHRPLTKMDKSDRNRTCYLHACLKYATREFMTNATIRQRFGIEVRNTSFASRIIKDAIDAKLIKPYDKDAGRRFMKYEPFWA